MSVLNKPLFVLTVAAFISFAPAAWSQDDTGTAAASCNFGGMVFSQGATLLTGETVGVCDETGAWVPTLSKAAGCLHAGKFYSSGAAVSVGDGTITCADNGTWS